MGLDITAYSKLRKLDCIINQDWEPINPETRKPIKGEFFVVGVNPYFPGRAEGVEDKAVYRYDDSHGFRAGSYGSYNRWREQLACLAGFPAEIVDDKDSYEHGKSRHDAGAFNATGGPFWELINFSDCEGVIGPVVSAKLLKDFNTFANAAAAFGEKEHDEWFYPLYQDWHKAFKLAADGGCVDFH